jgi:hypothetical protein
MTGVSNVLTPYSGYKTRGEPSENIDSHLVNSGSNKGKKKFNKIIKVQNF